MIITREQQIKVLSQLYRHSKCVTVILKESIVILDFASLYAVYNGRQLTLKILTNLVYGFIGGNKAKAYEKVEDPLYALENGIAIDTEREFILENQLEREFILECNECDPNNLQIQILSQIDLIINTHLLIYRNNNNYQIQLDTCLSSIILNTNVRRSRIIELVFEQLNTQGVQNICQTFIFVIFIFYLLHLH